MSWQVIRRVVILLTLAMVLPDPVAAGLTCGYEGPNKAFEGQEYKGRFVCSGEKEIDFSIAPHGRPIRLNPDGSFRLTPVEAEVNSGTLLLTVLARGGSETARLTKTLKVFKSIRGDHVVVRWSRQHTTDSYAHYVLKAMETGRPNAWDVFTQRLGYPGPPDLGGELLEVMVGPISGNYFWALGLAYPPYMGDPPRIHINTGQKIDELKSTCAHELFHTFQYYYRNRIKWWLEATAEWAADQVFPNYRACIDRQTNPSSILSRPTVHLLDSEKYAACLVPTFLDQYLGDPDVVKRSWELLADDGMKIDRVLRSREVLGQKDFARVWRDFIIRNGVIHGLEGYSYEDGAAIQTKAVRALTLNAARNHHFLGKAQGASTLSQPTTPLPITQKGVRPGDPGFAALTKTIPGMSAYYLQYEIPQGILGASSGQVAMQVAFEGDENGSWSCDVLRIRPDGAFLPEILEVAGLEKGRRGSNEFMVGGRAEKAVSQVILVIGNADPDKQASKFKLSAAIAPCLREAYRSNLPQSRERDPLTGTTATVLNANLSRYSVNTRKPPPPGEDNIFRNGETIKLQVTPSGPIQLGSSQGAVPPGSSSLSVDFSAIDSEYRPGAEKVSELRGGTNIFTVEYTISTKNKLLVKDQSDDELIIPVTLTSLCEFESGRDKWVDKGFRVSLDNKPPTLERIRIVQDQAGREVVVYDSRESIWNPAVLPDKGYSELKATLWFDESMQIVDEWVQAQDPEIWIPGRPKNLIFIRDQGWSRTTMDNDTWQGRLRFTAKDILPQAESVLTISALDRAGNEIDTEPDKPGPQADSSHVIQWRTPLVKQVSVIQNGRIIYDSIAGKMLSGRSGEYTFTLLFNDPMAQAGLAFGPKPPYDQTAVRLSPTNPEKTEWSGSLTLSPETAHQLAGVHRMRISGFGSTGLPLDGDPDLAGAQPETGHTFLIGAPSAWQVRLKFAERVTAREDPEVLIVLDVTTSLTGLSSEVWLDRGFTRERLIKEYSDLLTSYRPYISQYNERIIQAEKRLKGVKRENLVSALKKDLAIMEGTARYSELALGIVSKLHLHRPYRIMTDAGGSYRWTDKECDLVLGVKSSGFDIWQEVPGDYSLEGYTIKPGSDGLHQEFYQVPPPPWTVFTLMVSNLAADDLAELDRLHDDVSFMAVNKARDLGLDAWRDLIRTGEKPGQGPFLTLLLDPEALRGLAIHAAGYIVQDDSGCPHGPSIGYIYEPWILLNDLLKAGDYNFGRKMAERPDGKVILDLDPGSYSVTQEFYMTGV